jgi:molybdate transport system substrate-binding protein
VRVVRLACTLLMVAGIASCASGSAAQLSSSAAEELQVYAAASLQPALVKVKAVYEAEHPGVTLTVSTDSSTALETKIEQGAPADVFLSADTANPERLVAKGLATTTMAVFARNRLTVIVPRSNPAGISTPVDLARSGVKVIAAAAGVPIQKYTAAWIAKVSALPAYGADFAVRYAANVVSREDNVGAVVAKVALSEGDAAVVYVTDALASGQVETIDIPDDQNVPASYGGVVVNGSRHPAAAMAFLSWLVGSGGQQVLATFGFLPPTT